MYLGLSLPGVHSGCTCKRDNHSATGDLCAPVLRSQYSVPSGPNLGLMIMRMKRFSVKRDRQAVAINVS